MREDHVRVRLGHGLIGDSVRLMVWVSHSDGWSGRERETFFFFFFF